MNTTWKSAATVLCLVLFMLGCSNDQNPEVDLGALETQESLSESLANDLLGFSVAMRKADGPQIANYWEERIFATPLNLSPSEPEQVANGVDSIQWNLDSSLDEFDRETYLADLQSLLTSANHIEDVRFKVKSVEFSDNGTKAHAKLKFFVVGTNAPRGREWFRGFATIDANRQDDHPWKIHTFEITSLTKLSTDQEWFTEVSGPAGLNVSFPLFGEGSHDGFVNHGAAAADLNQDGLIDIVSTGIYSNYLYLNAGNGSFVDASESSRLKFTPPGSGVVFLDYDNDGDKDIFMARVGEQLLLQNQLIPSGELLFKDVSLTAGVDHSAVGFSAVVADINNDSWQDIYICSYNRYGTIMPNSWTGATNGTPNLLFINNGDGTFAERSNEWNVADSRWSYAAQFIDLDEDGDQDLYVANDFGDNAFYANEGNQFVDRSQELGVVDSGFGMGVSFGDYDRDGDFDLHVTNMSSTAGKRILELLYPKDHPMRLSLDKQAEGNSLYRNTDNGTFENVSSDVGGLGGGWAFGGGFVDLDCDGWLDLHTPNGFVSGETMKDT